MKKKKLAYSVYVTRLLVGQGAKEWAKERDQVIVEDKDLIERKRVQK